MPAITGSSGSSYFYPGGSAPRLLTSYQDLRLVEVNSAPDAIGDTASVFLSESGGTQGLYWVNDSGTVSAVGSGGGGGVDPASDIELNVGSKLILNADETSDNYFVESSTDVVELIMGGARLFAAQPGNRLLMGPGIDITLLDNTRLNMGTSGDYWHTYNSAGSYEFWHTNVDGSNTDGKVWWVDDGTDDVNFSGSLKLNVGSKLIFDGDEDSDTYIKGTATDNIDIFNGGAFTARFSSAGNLQMDGGIVVLSDTSLRLASSGKNYWLSRASMVSPADGQWSLTDNLATTGATLDVTTADTFTIKDQAGTGAGNLALDVGGKLLFDADEDSDTYIEEFTTDIVRFKVGNANAFYIRPEGPQIYDNISLFLGTGRDYWHTYNLAGSYEFWSTNVDGSNTPGIVWSVDDGTDDVNFSGSLNLRNGQKIIFDTDQVTAGNFIQSVTTSLMNVAINNGTVFSFSSGRATAPVNTQLGAGTYYLIDNTTGGAGSGALEFWSTNSDGSNTDGKVWWVEDGTDDVNFSGGINLNVGEKLVLDGDGDAYNYIEGTSSNVSFYVLGQQRAFVNANGIAPGTGRRVMLSSDSRYWFFWDSGSSALQFHSTDVDGGGTNGKVWWVEDGTDDVNFSGSLKLNVGSKLIFDGDDGSTNWIDSADATTLRFVVGNSPALYMKTAGPYLADSKSFGFGSSIDQTLTYTDGTGVTWNDGTNNVLTIPDDSNQIVLAGGSILSSDGTVTLGGTGGTNNENLVLDFETTANVIGFSSTTGASLFTFGGSTRVNSSSAMYWFNRTKLWSDADGQLQIENSANSSGATLDVTTADTFTIKDQAGTGAGHLATSGQLYSILSATETPTGTTETIDWNNGNSQVLDLGSATGDVTLTLSNGQAGASYVIKVVQDATTPRDIVWPGSVLWPDGTTPVISTGASAVDIVSLFFDGTSYYANIGQNYA
jgi:hypothetical protein